MTTGSLGKVYQDNEIIIRQGDKGNCMFVIQEGVVEVLKEEGAKKVLLAELGKGEFFGEMALFEDEVRLATVRAKGEVRAVTIDKKNFLKRVHQDPSIAYRLVQSLIDRLQEANTRIMQIVELSQSGQTIRIGVDRKKD